MDTRWVITALQIGNRGEGCKQYKSSLSERHILSLKAYLEPCQIIFDDYFLRKYLTAESCELLLMPLIACKVVNGACWLKPQTELLQHLEQI